MRLSEATGGGCLKQSEDPRDRIAEPVRCPGRCFRHSGVRDWSGRVFLGFGGLVLLSAVALLVLVETACGSAFPSLRDKSVQISMRDGVSLATDLYFPEKGRPPYPVILIRTPYNKSWLAGYGHYYARFGFCVAIQDVRGRWASQGTWEPFVHEGDDGFDTVEWLGTRPWSTGKVGMVGGSYSGTAQFLAALEKPPHLVTIVPNVAPAVPFDDIPRDGGAFALGWALRWTNIVENAKTGQDLQRMLQQSIVEDWSDRLSGLPVVDLDRSVVGHEVRYLRDWMRHSPGDEYWKCMTYLSQLSSLELPVFLQSGWFDPGTRGTRLAFQNIVRGGNRHVRLVVGPWSHGDRGPRRVNGQDMGAEAERDLMGEYRKWFDFWLKTDARDAPGAPGVELYVMGANRWVSGERFPLAATRYRQLYLARSEDGRGVLEWTPPRRSGGSDTFVYDPGKPTPSFFAALKRGALESYLARVNSGGDVLVYESEPLKEPLEVVGPIEASLYASSSAVDTDWTATLYGLTQTGSVRVLGLTFGILRARYREGIEDPSMLEPGKVYAFNIDLNHTAVTIRQGERLRLEIASAAFPEYSRNLNTGGNNELEKEWVEARQHVYHTATYPSHLRLPVLDPAR